MARTNRRLTRRSRYAPYSGGPDPLAPPVDLTEARAQACSSFSTVRMPLPSARLSLTAFPSRLVCWKSPPSHSTTRPPRFFASIR